MIRVQNHWKAAFEGPARAELENILPAFLAASRWFGGKAKTIRSARLADVLQEQDGAGSMVLGLIDVSYHEGGTDMYTLPMTAAFEMEADRITRDHPQAIIAALTVMQAREERSGILYDALWSQDCAYSLLASMGRSKQFQGAAGTLTGSATELFDEASRCAHAASSSVLKGEQSNTSVKFGDCAIMKLYRRIEPGMNPELEVGRTLTARHFAHSPALIGALEYVRERAEPMTLALTQSFVANEGNAWDYTLTQLAGYINHILTLDRKDSGSPQGAHEPLDHERTASDLLFAYRDAAHLLGRRTGELHLALGQASDTAAFAPEACSESYVQSRVHAMQQSATQALALLRRRLPSLSETDRKQAETVLEREPILLNGLGALARSPLSTLRIRCHGDYHLGQVLYTGRDFVIIDFEGEPAKPLAERRAKFLPLVDLAGMIRSFHYAAHVALRAEHRRHSHPPVTPNLLPWLEQWYQTARAAFLRGYQTTAGQAAFSPRSQEEFTLLLDVHILDKALYELTYELNNRPDWVALPLTGLLQSVDTSQAVEDMENENTATEGPIPRSADKKR